MDPHVPKNKVYMHNEIGQGASSMYPYPRKWQTLEKIGWYWRFTIALTVAITIAMTIAIG